MIYYGPDGTLRSIGAQTEREGTDTLARDSQWNKAEWFSCLIISPGDCIDDFFSSNFRFKLHLRPRTRATTSVSDDIPPLPPGKTAVDVFADFLRYMKGCAKTYIEETHPVDGLDFWRSGKEEYILSHPNAWEGAQQTLMRRAAVQAGLVPDTPEGQARISFITEGEASLNFCVDRGLTNDPIRVSHSRSTSTKLIILLSTATASRSSMPGVELWILVHMQRGHEEIMNSKRLPRQCVGVIYPVTLRVPSSLFSSFLQRINLCHSRGKEVS